MPYITSELGLSELNDVHLRNGHHEDGADEGNQAEDGRRPHAHVALDSELPALHILSVEVKEALLLLLLLVVSLVLAPLWERAVGGEGQVGEAGHGGRVVTPVIVLLNRRK